MLSLRSFKSSHQGHCQLTSSNSAFPPLSLAAAQARAPHLETLSGAAAVASVSSLTEATMETRKGCGVERVKRTSLLASGAFSLYSLQGLRNGSVTVCASVVSPGVSCV